MEKINKLFKGRITDLSILFIIICNYFGLLFIINSSSYIIGVILSLIFSVLIGIGCRYVKEKLIENKNINFKNKLINKFTFLWVSFIIIGLLNYIVISHIYNINFTYKAQIQKDVNDKLSSFDKFSSELNQRLIDDFQNLNETIKRKKVGLGYSISDSYKLADSYTKIPREQANEEFRRNDSIIYSKKILFRKVFKEWQVTDLMKNYNDLVNYNEQNYKTINLQLKNLPLDKSPLKEPLNNNNLPLNNPFKLNAALSHGLNGYLIPILLIFITHLIVLVPYFKIHKQYYHKGNEPIGAKVI